MVKLWMLMHSVDSYNYSKLLLFPYFQNKIVYMQNLCKFTSNLSKIQTFSLAWLKI